MLLEEDAHRIEKRPHRLERAPTRRDRRRVELDRQSRARLERIRDDRRELRLERGIARLAALERAAPDLPCRLDQPPRRRTDEKHSVEPVDEARVARLVCDDRRDPAPLRAELEPQRLVDRAVASLLERPAGGVALAAQGAERALGLGARGGIERRIAQRDLARRDLVAHAVRLVEVVDVRAGARLGGAGRDRREAEVRVARRDREPVVGDDRADRRERLERPREPRHPVRPAPAGAHERHARLEERQEDRRPRRQRAVQYADELALGRREPRVDRKALAPVPHRLLAAKPLVLAAQARHLVGERTPRIADDRLVPRVVRGVRALDRGPPRGVERFAPRRGLAHGLEARRRLDAVEVRPAVGAAGRDSTEEDHDEKREVERRDARRRGSDEA